MFEEDNPRALYSKYLHRYSPTISCYLNYNVLCKQSFKCSEISIALWTVLPLSEKNSWVMIVKGQRKCFTAESKIKEKPISRFSPIYLYRIYAPYMVLECIHWNSKQRARASTYDNVGSSYENLEESKNVCDNTKLLVLVLEIISLFCHLVIYT